MQLKNQFRKFNLTMNPEDKKLWVEALRSGKYMQGKGNLAYTENEKCFHCCLGVFAEVKGVKKGDTDDLGSTVFIIPMGNSFESMEISFLPVEWFKQFFTIPEVIEHECDKIQLIDALEAKLISFNDGGKYDFDEIAQWIDTNL